MVCVKMKTMAVNTHRGFNSPVQLYPRYEA
jgi:hypothetical protein